MISLCSSFISCTLVMCSRVGTMKLFNVLHVSQCVIMLFQSDSRSRVEVGRGWRVRGLWICFLALYSALGDMRQSGGWRLKPPQGSSHTLLPQWLIATTHLVVYICRNCYFALCIGAKMYWNNHYPYHSEMQKSIVLVNENLKSISR